MSVRQRLRHHKAKIEYLACEETIFQMLSQGFSKRLIHEELTEKGTLSMAYITLCQFIRKAKKKDATPPASGNKTPPASPPRQSTPRIGKATPDTFQDPRTIDPSTII